jgi:predicted O-methyltransferase YrrM
MKPEEVFAHVGHLPYMRLEQARILFDLIVPNRLHNCLELGFYHGTSSAYIAGAIDELQAGTLTTIDLEKALERTPNIHEVLEGAGLSQWVTVFAEPRSYNWRLMKFLEEGRTESFDFCYLDGGHTWYDTGFGFCLVDRLLKPGGWIVFDDLNYTYRNSSHSDATWVRKLPEEEQTIAQVERVFNLLVKTHPQYRAFRRTGQFGFAQKKPAA